ncbi:MAG: hypothetical protein QXU74_02515 [Candidatus Aenigmatarchaeota archaeon]
MKKVDKCIYLLSDEESIELGTKVVTHSYGFGGAVTIQVPKYFSTEEKFYEVLEHILKKYDIEQNEENLKTTTSAIFRRLKSSKYVAFYVCGSVCSELEQIRFIMTCNKNGTVFLMMRTKQESYDELIKDTPEVRKNKKAGREIMSLQLDLDKLFEPFLEIQFQAPIQVQ